MLAAGSSAPSSTGASGPAPSSGPSSSAAKAEVEIHYSAEYPKQVWYLVVSLLFVVGVFQHGSWLLHRYARRRRARDVEAGPAPPTGRWALRRLPEAIANAYRVVAFRCTVSFGGAYTLNVAEVFVTCVYIVALFTWNFVNTYGLVEGNWDSRAATIAASQLPLVVALGTKNNVVSYITRIGHEKLNYLHRMTARVVFVLLWVHAGGKLHTGKPEDYEDDFRRLGLMTITAFTLLIMVSIRPIRAASYELFFIVHFLLVLIMLLGAYFHAVQRGGGAYIWPCFLVWGLDRAVRLARTVAYNYNYFGLGAARKAALDATAERLSPHFVRLRLARPPHFHWAPGQTAYLTMPGVSALPWEAHPFTIASIEAADAVGQSVDEKGAGGGAPMWRELVFLIGVRDGVTKRLAAAAEKGAKVRVAVDGPYGFSPDLSCDDTAVLVAGSSGVSYTLATFLSVVEAARLGTTKCRRAVFIWSIRDAAHVEWVSQTLSQALSIAPPQLSISIRIYVTSGEPPPSRHPDAWEDDSIHSASDGEKDSTRKSRPPSLLGFPAVEVFHGRPDLRVLLRDEAAANAGRMSVTVCGSYGIVHACRAALRFPVSSPAGVLRGRPDVVLHVESFGYA